MKSESFDIVTAFDVMEHLNDDLKALLELKRVCKSKGMILLTVPAHQWLWSNNDVAYHHKRRYSLRDLETLIKQAKLKMEKVSYFNTFLFPAFVAVTLMAKHSNNLTSITLRPLPNFLNNFLTKLMYIEARLIRRVRLPVGSSIICAIKKVQNEVKF